MRLCHGLAALSLLLAAACSFDPAGVAASGDDGEESDSGTPPVEENPEIRYHIRILQTQGFQSLIDGVPSEGIDVVFPSAVEASATTYTIELAYQGLVVDTMTAEPGGCADAAVSYCATSNGELGVASTICVDGDFVSVGDGHCPATCSPFVPGTCGAELRCGDLLLSAKPLFARIACTPPGEKEVGQRCGRGEPGDLGFDDCEPTLTCHEGTCRRFCSTAPPVIDPITGQPVPQPGDCLDGEVCFPIPGRPPEFGACLPPLPTDP
jgi:hypothetical protein